MPLAGIPPEDLEKLPTQALLDELRRRHEVLSNPPVRFALLGLPCVGKRTQAEALRRNFSVCRIPAEDIWAAVAEAQVAESTAASSTGSSSPTRQELSVDDRAVTAVLALMKRPQCRRGFVLEGFPSTAKQAELLGEALTEHKAPLNHAIFLESGQEEAMQRCSGRRVHEASGRLYHEEFRKPAKAGLDDVTGEPVVPVDLPPETLRKAFSTFADNSGSLREWYEKAGLARSVDASTREIRKVTDAIGGLLKGSR
eukprot:TRINITY_DN35759_c0_g1_i1.p1 TRINITY_DN35759_c0_g1~~TRINITY_DN35759_c0_g1_i1.p1  ORF type:complete len:255 (-),score=74.11 TRINITY_DN35759_c0_g1_i1:76-840(-)